MTLYRELKEKSILMIDPDPWTRDSLSLLLRWKDCRFASCDSVEAGHRAIDAEPFDIVICAHGAPGVDGLAFLAHCRIDHPDAVRILIGTLGDPQYGGDGGCPGFHAWIPKPLTIEAVEQALRDAIVASRNTAGDPLEP